jgi:hypothetical protein
MDKTVVVNLDSEPVRFTPDGKISVVDAIRAVSNSNRPRAIWENVKVKHPEILTYCEHYPFQGERPVLVANSKGWERILMVLPDYLSDQDLA